MEGTTAAGPMGPLDPPSAARPERIPARPAFDTHSKGGPELKEWKLELVLYFINGACALLIPAIQDEAGMGFDSWWMRG